VRRALGTPSAPAPASASASASASAASGGSGGGGGGAGSGGRSVKWERKLDRSSSSRVRQVEALFQRVVSEVPTQVLRYAYDGSPLWCTLPRPIFPTTTTPPTPPPAAAAACSGGGGGGLEVPPCEVCGKRRVFEFQVSSLALVPALTPPPPLPLPLTMCDV